MGDDRSAALSRAAEWLLHAAVVGVVLITAGACSDDGAPASAPLSSAASGTETPDADATASPLASAVAASGGSSSIQPSPTGTEPATSPTTPGQARGERMTYAELFRRRQELVGHTVDVDGKVFFYSKCPPPDGTASECTLAGYLTAPDRNDLTASDLKDALAMSEGGRLVSCPESKAVDGACPGWRHAIGYRVVAVVEHQVLGGRTTQQIELEVTSRRTT